MKESLMDELALLEQAVTNPAGYATEWKRENSGRIIATICSYTPIEILIAADALPLRVFGSGGEFSFSDTLLQTYCCSLVRSILNDVLSGKLNYIDGAVFPHTCDSMQRLSDIWRLNTRFLLHLDVVLPVKLNTPAAAEYLVQVMRKFKKDLETHLDMIITEEKLRAAIRQTNAVRKALMTLDRIRMTQPEVFSAKDMSLAVRAAMIMAPARWLSLATDLLAALGRKSGPVSSSDRKIVLSGGMCGSPDIYEIIKNSGGVVVHDDMCTGNRFFEGLIDEERDPLTAIADRYRERIICPAKHTGLFARADYLVRTVREKKADGVIFLLLKFCDPHAFDYPYLKQRLDKENIPSLLLEVEDQSVPGQQVTTRTEAFMEML